MQLSILVLHIVGIVRRKLGIDMAITELIIDRALWGAGLLLRSEDNTMCCLGFASLACGVSMDYIRDVGVPQYSWTEVNKWMRESRAPSCTCHTGTCAVSANPDAIDDVINTNDSHDLSGPDKESKLIEIFDKNGVKLSFIGNYRPNLVHGNC